MMEMQTTRMRTEANRLSNNWPYTQVYPAVDENSVVSDADSDVLFVPNEAEADVILISDQEVDENNNIGGTSAGLKRKSFENGSGEEVSAKRIKREQRVWGVNNHGLTFEDGDVGKLKKIE